MPDQAAHLAIAASPTAVSECPPGPALDTDVSVRVIPLDTRRWRPSAEATAASRACHPAQMGADRRSSPLSSPRLALAVASPS